MKQGGFYPAPLRKEFHDKTRKSLKEVGGYRSNRLVRVLMQKSFIMYHVRYYESRVFHVCCPIMPLSI